MSLTILGQQVTSDYLFEGTESASMNDVFGYIAKQRVVKISDNKAEWNPFAANSRLGRTNWRNGEFTDYDESGRVIFGGAINDAGYQFTRGGRVTQIAARDNLGMLKDDLVEELTLKSENSLSTQYTVQGNHASLYASTINLNNAGGPVDIAVGDIVSFNPNSVPRYQVITVDGSSPTGQITLDRPLEFAVTAGTVLRVMSPKTATGPELLRRAFIAAGVADRLDNTFLALDLADTLAGLNLRVFVRLEDKMKLSEYLAKVMELTDLILTVTPDNQISVRRGMQYDGGRITAQVTDSELIHDITMEHDTSRLYWAYDCLYYNAGQVAIKSREVNSIVLSRWAATQRWQPITGSKDSPRDYQFLYATEACAQFFGDRILDYYGHARPVLKCKLARNPDGYPGRPYRLTLGSQVLITHSFGGGRGLVNEPASVKQFVFDRATQVYTDVLFELTNRYYPQLPVTV